MARVTVEDCLERVENRFALVHLATQRTRQLMKGSHPLIHHPKNKEAVVSLREIAAGHVSFRQNAHDLFFEQKERAGLTNGQPKTPPTAAIEQLLAGRDPMAI